MAVVREVTKNSPFYKKIKSGDELLSVNGRKIHDVLDFMYETADTESPLTVCVCRDGEHLSFKERCPYGTGLEFDNFLMDCQRHCANKCVFCFIDQMPPNMRNTLYFKDDDFRLSLIYGNYVTLTNAKDEDIDRICEMKVSPLNISVHATDPEVRVKLMKNPRAANIMNILNRFKESGINMRCQIVLCPHLNDGKILEKTLEDLYSLFPEVSSVSVVPVGLTKFRENLASLECFTPEGAKEALDIINRFGDRSEKEHGQRVFYGADEFYLKADIDVPPAEFYGEMEQYEDGVGMISLFKDDFEYFSSEVEPSDKKMKLSLVTGVAAEETINNAMKGLSEKFEGLEYKVYTIINHYFGEQITVAGLITATDIIEQLKDKPLGDRLIIPDIMLRDDCFLDDLTVRDVEKALDVKICVAGEGAEGLIKAVEDCIKH